MSKTQVRNSFFPRFFVSQEGLNADVLLKESVPSNVQSEDSNANSDLWSQFVEDLSENKEDFSLGLICFEEVQGASPVADMLDKLVQAIKQNEYRLYRLPDEAEFSLNWLQKAVEKSDLKNKKFIVFGMKNEKTEFKVLNSNSNIKCISTYGLSALSANVNFKKDLWMNLKKHFD